MAELDKIGIDDIVASAASGVLRAMTAHRIVSERHSIADLVASGFTVDFHIRAGGPFANIGSLAGLGKFGGQAGNGQVGGQLGN